MEKENRKVKYTKLVLRESLLTLMRDKPIGRITVSELCELADINRGTFYQHYEDVYDLLGKIEDDFYQKVLDSVGEIDIMNSVENILLRVFTAVSESRDLCVVLFSEYGDKDFLRKCCSVGNDVINKQWSDSSAGSNARHTEYMYAYAVNGMVGVIEHWIKHGFSRPPAELAALSKQLIYGGMSSFFENHTVL